jgi:CheY-like chemotaxis protein/chemotaxis signal transduction protein
MVAKDHIVVIDDSEAILVFARSVLSPHYTVSTAKNGRDGLDLIARVLPQLVVLDLSMPELDGEQVLAQLQAAPLLASIPVVIISSEQRRAEACLAKGATAHLVKPLGAEDLAATVARALESARAHAARERVAVLPLAVGPLELAVPLRDVRRVILQTAMDPLPGGPSYLTGSFELHGHVLCVLDLAARFGVDHAQPLVDRKLIVVEYAGIWLALCADDVRDPEEVAPADIYRVHPGTDPEDALDAVVKTTRGSLPLIRPHALLSRGLVRSLHDLLERTEAR